MNNRLHSYFQFQISFASLDEIRIRIASIMQYYGRRYVASQYRLRDAIDQIFYFHSPVFTYHRILLIDSFGQYILRLSWSLSSQLLQLRSQLYLFTKTQRILYFTIHGAFTSTNQRRNLILFRNETRLDRYFIIKCEISRPQHRICDVLHIATRDICFYNECFVMSKFTITNYEQKKMLSDSLLKS